MNETDFVDLGLACADICTALGRGMDGKKLNDLSQSVSEAIGQLTTWVEPTMHNMDHPLTLPPDRRTVAEIQEKVIKRSGRNPVSRFLHAKNDKETIATWKSDLNRILHVFNVGSVIFTWLSLITFFQTELAMNTHVTVSGIRHDVSKIREEIGGQGRSVSLSYIRPIGNREILTVP